MTDPAKSPDRNYELVTCVTPDTVKLHGLFQASSSATQSSIQAAVVLHGLGGNFYSSSLNLRLADALNELGISVVLGNTRGHDGVSMSPVGGRAQTIGAAYEIVDDCRYDVTGWVNWLVDKKGYNNIALIGHSLGAIKSLYAHAWMPHEKVDAIVGLSATRLCHEKFLDSARADDFRKWFSRASELVQEGNEADLIKVEFPFPTHMAAGAYRDKYGPENKYDWFGFANQIDVPALLMFGERELNDNAAFHGLREQATAFASEQSNFDISIIESANHFYAGVHHRATEAMQQWLREKLT